MSLERYQKIRRLEESVVELGMKVRELEADYKKERDQRIKLEGQLAAMKVERDNFRDRVIALTN